jgi:hypothetical protein
LSRPPQVRRRGDAERRREAEEGEGRGGAAPPQERRPEALGSIYSTRSTPGKGGRVLRVPQVGMDGYSEYGELAGLSAAPVRPEYWAHPRPVLVAWTGLTQQSHSPGAGPPS